MIRDKNDADGSYFNIIRALTDTVRAPRLDSGCTQAWGPSDHVFLLPKGLPIPSKQKQKGSRESMEKGGVVVKIGIGCQGCLLITASGSSIGGLGGAVALVLVGPGKCQWQ